MLAPGEENLKVPAWLNDPTLYHNRGDTTFEGENSFYGDFFGLDDLFTEHPKVVDGMTDIYEKWIRRLRRGRLPDRHHEARQRRVLAAVRPARSSTTPRPTARTSSLCSARSSTPPRASPRSSPPATRCRPCSTFPFQDAARNFASRGQAAKGLETFFAGDDWYTDADSNVYQLPTFLGNHDMGRIGSFITADNPEADDAERVARDRLAHELMYFSRGNPVVYYGDEQGFTGPGGDQDARQTMFASQVPDYLDDDLLGTDATHAARQLQHRPPAVPRHQRARRPDRGAPGAAQRRPPEPLRLRRVRASTPSPGSTPATSASTWSAVNNSEAGPDGSGPDLRGQADVQPDLRGRAPPRSKTAADGKLTVTVPPLSAVVYESAGRIPHSKAAPAVTLQDPAPAAADNSRVRVAADVDGSSFYEVTFQARTAGGAWASIGTDDTAPYQVFHDVSALTPAPPWSTAPWCWTTAAHTSVSQPRSGTVPAPVLSLVAPKEGSSVNGKVEVSAVASPEKADYAVRFERSISGGDWSEIGEDSSSPAYTAVDDLGALARAGRHPAALPGADGRPGRGRGGQRDPHRRGRGASRSPPRSPSPGASTRKWAARATGSRIAGPPS